MIAGIFCMKFEFIGIWYMRGLKKILRKKTSYGEFKKNGTMKAKNSKKKTIIAFSSLFYNLSSLNFRFSRTAI
jgi:hypothetical protein